ncbi:hypothetical protein COLO4_29419 [Corchorus olitorius]|uniref:DUF4283 domain-containing protein n=1 Tax=Corchorus olitorius TaxID=93759 RepID=A0A1R3HEP3_9ROSI|nr:hypothetical protein COLO4_29419 [Corchorus olitorius]
MAGASLSQMCSKMSLQDEGKEKGKIIIDNEWIADLGGENNTHYLLGKLLLRKPVSTEGLRAVFQQVWRVEGELVVREVGERLFVFQFETGLDRDRVFVSQPWLFHKALLVLREYDGIQTPEEFLFDSCPFWLKVFGVPFKLMNEKVGIAIGESMGNVLDIDPITERYLRIRVDVDLRCPFEKGTILSTATGDVEVDFFFEKRPDYCWVCGRVDHQEDDCAEGIAQIKEQGFSIRKYKPEESSPRCLVKTTVSNVGQSGSRGPSRGKGTQGAPSSSFLASGRQGAFRNHVDSMLLQSRPVARALQFQEKSVEVVSRLVTSPMERGLGEEVVARRGIEAVGENQGEQGVGRKEGWRDLQMRKFGLLEGGDENGPLGQLTYRGNSGPNSLEQLYGNIPGVGPSLMGLNQLHQPNPPDLVQKGKRQKAGQEDWDAGSASGPNAEFNKLMRDAIAAGSYFEFGTDASKDARQIRKFKKTVVAAGVSAKYSFDPTATPSTLMEGKKLCSGCQIVESVGLGAGKRSRDGPVGEEVGQLGAYYISIGTDLPNAAGRAFDGAVGKTLNSQE